MNRSLISGTILGLGIIIFWFHGGLGLLAIISAIIVFFLLKPAENLEKKAQAIGLQKKHGNVSNIYTGQVKGIDVKICAGQETKHLIDWDSGYGDLPSGGLSIPDPYSTFRVILLRKLPFTSIISFKHHITKLSDTVACEGFANSKLIARKHTVSNDTARLMINFIQKYKTKDSTSFRMPVFMITLEGISYDRLSLYRLPEHLEDMILDLDKIAKSIEKHTK